MAAKTTAPHVSPSLVSRVGTPVTTGSLSGYDLVVKNAGRLRIQARAIDIDDEEECWCRLTECLEGFCLHIATMGVSISMVVPLNQPIG